MELNKTAYKRLGDYIREVDVRNRDLKVTKLVGLTIDKAFIPSVANVIGTDLSNYKVIRKKQFACSLMQVSRDQKMPVAMFKEDEAIMSPAYPMFEVINENVLLPEYLMMWFTRKEFDREASFYAVGGVRGSLTWEDFMDMTLPIPPIERQREIVSEYETLSRRIELNNKMIFRLEKTAQTLYRKMFVDGIDKENLPDGWKMGTLGEIIEIKDGTHDSPQPTKIGYPLLTSQHLRSWELSFEDAYCISKHDYDIINKRSLVETKDILYSMIGTIGLISYVLTKQVSFAVKNVAIFKTSKKSNLAEYILFYLKSEQTKQHINENQIGSTQNYITLSLLRNLSIVIPNECVISIFSKNARRIISFIYTTTLINRKLKDLQHLLLTNIRKL